MLDNGVALVSEDDRRKVAADVVARELEIAGERRRDRQAAPELAGLVRLARGIRMPVTRISADAGLTRPTVYDLSRRPTEFDSELTQIALLAVLANHRFIDAAGIASSLGLDPRDVLQTLVLLARHGQVYPAANGAPTPETPFKLMANGDTALQEHLELRRGQRAEGYSFYFEIPEADQHRVGQAASELLGDLHYDVLGHHIAHAMRMPELAIIVKADSDREAFEIAQDIWQQVAARAKLADRAPHLALALPPRSQR